MKTYLALALAAFLILDLTSCGSAQVVTTLEAVVASGEVAVSTLATIGTIPPATAALINQYLKAVDQAAIFASTELASADTPAVKATKIAQQFAGVIAPTLPLGTAQVVLSVVQAVIGAVANFLTAIQPATTVTAAKSVNLKLSAGDVAKLAAIHARAEALLVRIK